MRAGRSVSFVIAVLAALVFAPAAFADTAKYILPPGNFGGLPTTHELARPAAALRRADAAARATSPTADINKHFLPEDFAPIGADARGEHRPPGLRIIYDCYGVPHVYGKTRADVAFGAGWVTARDRGLLLHARPRPGAGGGRRRARHRRLLARHERPDVRAERRRPRRSSPSSSKLLVRDLRRQGPADPRRRPGLRRRHQRLLEGATASTQPPATVNDVIAVTAFIGSIFGAGGGGEASNSDLLAKLQNAARPGTRPRGVGRRHARRRPRGADHDQEALQLPAAHRRQGHAAR